MTAYRLDRSPSAPLPTPDDVIRTSARRIIALLEDRFGASGTDLRAKAESVRKKLGSDLTDRVITLADAEAGLAGLDEPMRMAEQILMDVVQVAPRPVAFRPLRSFSGVVSKVLISDRADSAELDLEGRLLTLRSPNIRIDPGDRVTVRLLLTDQAIAYFNETKQLGSTASTVFAKFLAVGIIAVLLGFTVIAISLLQAGSVWFGHSGALYRLIVTIGILLAVCVGAAIVYLGLFVVGFGTLAGTLGLDHFRRARTGHSANR